MPHNVPHQFLHVCPRMRTELLKCNTNAAAKAPMEVESHVVTSCACVYVCAKATLLILSWTVVQQIYHMFSRSIRLVLLSLVYVSSSGPAPSLEPADR